VSNANTQQGFFYIWCWVVGREALYHRCHRCGIFQMFPPEDRKRVWCCGQWRTKPEEGFWAGKLPRVAFAQPQALVAAPW
jgi:hypothetical protein